MPVALYGVELHERWLRATAAYAHTVSLHGSGTREAREAWQYAAELLDELMRYTPSKSYTQSPTTVSQ